MMYIYKLTIPFWTCATVHIQNQKDLPIPSTVSSLQVQLQTSIFSFNTLTDSIEQLLEAYTHKKCTHPVYLLFCLIGKQRKGVVWNILMHRKSKSILIDLKTTDILSHSLFNSLLYPHASRIYRWTKNIDFIPWKHWLKHINISYKGHVLKSIISGFSILMSLELYLHIIVLGYDKTNSKMNTYAISDFINISIFLRNTLIYSQLFFMISLWKIR